MSGPAAADRKLLLLKHWTQTSAADARVTRITSGTMIALHLILLFDGKICSSLLMAKIRL